MTVRFFHLMAYAPGIHFSEPEAVGTATVGEGRDFVAGQPDDASPLPITADPTPSPGDCARPTKDSETDDGDGSAAASADMLMAPKSSGRTDSFPDLPACFDRRSAA